MLFRSVADLAQQLHSSGIDYININGANSGSVTISDAQAQDLVAAGLAFSSGGAATPFLNNDGSPNVTTTHDHVTLATSQAAGTHLSTSLKDLQKLGVDTVLVAGATEATPVGLTVDFGSLSDGQGLNAVGLPIFGDINHDGVLSDAENAALNVTLNIAGDANTIAQEIGNVADLAQQLHNSGIDYINIKIGRAHV